ncbi:MAG: endonuclease III [Sphingobacteriia bacterium]|jgi:endonuclease III|nr:endonuclease III [Paludibacteraceae bacterium]NCA79874.1 endonuclease III [Sphingobacteriia bacterium]
MTKKERYSLIIKWFTDNMPVAESELHYHNAYELLVAVILSAQCTDKRVNLTTPAFFDDYPDVSALSKATISAVFDHIKSISYPNNKAKHLIGMANKVVQDFNGEIPKSTDELEQLPGVGRKTANVVVSVLYNQPKMAVDTHVFRISNRLGLTSDSKSPLQTEKELTKNIPETLIPKAHHWLILHGRYVCTARAPKCTTCGLSTYCKFYSNLKN